MGIKSFFKAVLYQPLYNLLVFFAWLVPGHSIGWSIIILTLFVKLLLWAPSVKAMKTPLEMRQYQPELKALQEKYKDDRAAQAQAQMAFYKEKGINPLSGCLPVLIQLPIIFILYQVFITALGQDRSDLLYSFTPHIALNMSWLGIDLVNPDRRFILPIIAAALQFFQTRHMQILQGPPVGNDMAASISKQMLYLFPIMTFVITLSLPAGLALYWASSTLFSWHQQLYVAKNFKPAVSKVAVTVRKKARR